MASWVAALESYEQAADGGFAAAQSYAQAAPVAWPPRCRESAGATAETFYSESSAHLACRYAGYVL